MALQIVSIKDSKIKFVNEGKDEDKTIRDVQADILFESMNDKMRIAQLEEMNALMLIEIMNIKTGVK